MKRKNKFIEFRFYEKAYDEPALILAGEKWEKTYGEDKRELHFHNMLEIGYCYSGEGHIVIDEEEIPYGQDSFTFIPANCLHTTLSKGENKWSFLYFDISEVVERFWTRDKIIKHQILQELNNKAIVAGKESYYLGNLIRFLFEIGESGEKGLYYKELMNSSLYVVLLHILRMKEDVWERKTDIRGNKVLAALEYVEKNYAKDIKTAELARMCSLSETHFRRLFEEEMNVTPIEYVNFIRIRKACELIEKGESYIEHVAQKVGYRSMPTFYRNFKTLLGESPNQYRKRMNTYTQKKSRYNIDIKKGWIL